MINPMRFFTGIIFPRKDPVKAGISMDNGVLFQSHGMQRRMAYPLSPIFSSAKVLMPDSWRLSMQEKSRHRILCFLVSGCGIVLPVLVMCIPEDDRKKTTEDRYGQVLRAEFISFHHHLSAPWAASSEKRAYCRGNCTIFVQSL